MSGYCAVGRVSIETVPTSTVSTAMTMATMGRRIKNFDMIQLPAAGLVAGAGGAACGATGAPSRSFCRLSMIT